jgi:hypothetical protein
VLRIAGFHRTFRRVLPIVRLLFSWSLASGTFRSENTQYPVSPPIGNTWTSLLRIGQRREPSEWAPWSAMSRPQKGRWRTGQVTVGRVGQSANGSWLFDELDRRQPGKSEGVGNPKGAEEKGSVLKSLNRPGSIQKSGTAFCHRLEVRLAGPRIRPADPLVPGCLRRAFGRQGWARISRPSTTAGCPASGRPRSSRRAKGSVLKSLNRPHLVQKLGGRPGPVWRLAPLLSALCHLHLTPVHPQGITRLPAPRATPR